MFNQVLLRSRFNIGFRSFCSSKNADKLNKLKEKLNKEALSPNSPIGAMDRIPKKENSDTKSDAEYVDVFAKFPGNVNPKTGEIGGPTGPEPTRYNDWERKGRCTDF